MSNLREFFAGLPRTTGGITAKLEVADQVIGQAVEQLLSSGTPSLQVAIVLAFQLKAIADKEGWSEEMKAEYLGARILAG